ncbi:DUF2863 family protein [Leeia sp. TBRC 13508]|uniref:DUF2863 family protein n=1 Tax=Leeia speluncae TaxID=2884804 RepID=A0ABS8D7L2_9NEIS|nr:DUF2863 family protein [Leeia speluncae]MCB6184184.1 DUF2863 family protein [Leeia speluncae]
MSDWRDELSEAGRVILAAIEGLASSGSQVEARSWAITLSEMLGQLMAQEEDAQLNQVLTLIQGNLPELHEVLMPWVEAIATKIDSTRPQATTQLMALPILTWSRFKIPDTTVSLRYLETLHQYLVENVFAGGVGVSIVNKWFSPEQLPSTYSAAYKLLQSLPDKHPVIDVSRASYPEVELYLCDVRYLLIKVKLPRNGALFVWQEPPFQKSKMDVLEGLNSFLQPMLTTTLPGCVSKAMLPDALFTAWKTADMSSRHYAVNAAATFLSMTLEVAVADLVATVSVFERDDDEEIRIGFTTHELGGIQYGLIWPLWGDDLPNQLVVVNELLTSLALRDVIHFSTNYSVLEDDGFDTPAYVDMDGHVVEALMPENTPTEWMLH